MPNHYSFAIPQADHNHTAHSHLPASKWRLTQEALCDLESGFYILPPHRVRCPPVVYRDLSGNSPILHPEVLLERAVRAISDQS